MTIWREIGDRVFVRRYAFYDQNIGVVLGGDEALVIDTRSTHVQAREILTDLRELTRDAGHGRRGHPRPLRPRLRQPRLPAGGDLGPDGCVAFMSGPAKRAGRRSPREEPDLAEDLAEVVIDPPDRTFAETAAIDVGGRRVELRYLGRGHTDHDIVIDVPDAGVMFAGDLMENGAVPFFGDGYPLDWPRDGARGSPSWRPATVVPGPRRPRRPGVRRWTGGGTRCAVAELARGSTRGAVPRRCGGRDAVPGLRGRSRSGGRSQRAIVQLRGELD